MSSELPPFPKITGRGTRARAHPQHEPMQGNGYSTAVPKTVATSQPILGHMPLWDSDKCSDFVNYFEGSIDLDGWSSFIHSLIYALKQVCIKDIIMYQARRINTTVGKHGPCPEGDRSLGVDRKEEKTISSELWLGWPRYKVPTSKANIY